MANQEKLLDDVLSGRQPAEGETAAFAALGERIRLAYLNVGPPHNAERALFVQGAAARRRGVGWLRVFAPATLTAMLLLVVLMLGRIALPGDTLYPVREVLRSVGLAPATAAEVQEQLDQAEALINRATELQASNVDRAKDVALLAVRLLGGAEEMIEDLDSRDARSLSDRIDALLVRAAGLLALEEANVTDGLVDDEAARRDDDEGGEVETDEDEDDDTDGSAAAKEERTDDPANRDDDDDNSGPGGGDNDDDGDNSGPGGGDDTDDDGDNSGPGDGDDDDTVDDTADLDEEDEAAEELDDLRQ